MSTIWEQDWQRLLLTWEVENHRHPDAPPLNPVVPALSCFSHLRGGAAGFSTAGHFAISTRNCSSYLSLSFLMQSKVSNANRHPCSEHTWEEEQAMPREHQPVLMLWGPG